MTASVEGKRKTNLYTYFTVLTVSLLGFSLGIGTSWSSPILFKLQDANNSDNPFSYAISDSETTWIGSLNSLGCAIGPLPFGYFAGKVGRKPVLLAVASIFVGAYLVLAFAKTVTLYYVARFLVGTGFAGVFALMPTYVSEVAHEKDRGVLNAMTFVLVSLGLMTPYAVGPYLSIMAFNLFCAAFPLGFFVGFLILGVETPHFLVAKNDMKTAALVLEKLRGSHQENVQKELNEIQDYVNSNTDGSFLEIFKSKILLKSFILALTLYTFQQFCGLVPLTNYTQDIFEAAGTNLSSDIASIVISSFQFITTVIFVFFVSRFRFRTLLITSCTGIITSLTLFGTYFYLKQSTNVDTTSFGFMAIVTMGGIFVFYFIGIGSLPGVITSEIFPTNLRALVLATCMMLASTESFLLTKFFSSLNNAVGIAGSVWIFAGITTLGLIFIIFFIPETNGKSFQEIQDDLNHKGKK